jgi:hypothetical protein
VGEEPGGQDETKINFEYDFEIQEFDAGRLKMEVRPAMPGGILETPAVRVEGHAASLVEGQPNGDKAYNFESLSWEEAKGIPKRTAVLENLNILEWQNAISQVRLARNEDLSDDFTTRPEFIYWTPVVKFPNKIVPLLDNEIAINVAEVGAEEPVSRQLNVHLHAFFKELLDKDADQDFQLIKLECQYAYQLRSDGALPEVKLPVLLVPPYEFKIPGDWDLGNENSFVNQLAKGIETWFKEHLPADDNVDERFLFDVSIFSKLEKSKLPILRLRNVFLEVDRVSDLGS